jgi:hypothetical protein
MKILQIQKKLFLLSTILGLDLLSYTVQPYIPPSDKHSLSYTVESCPSHRNQNPVSELVLSFIKPDKAEGEQKNCFCFTCTCRRSSFIFLKSSVELSIDNYRGYLLPNKFNPLVKYFVGCTSSRSPPIFFG